MVKIIGKKNSVNLPKTNDIPSTTIVGYSLNKNTTHASNKQILLREKFKKCSLLLKQTKKVWMDGFYSLSNRSCYRECFSYNMHHAFQWRNKRWELNPSKVLLSKRVPGFTSKDFKVSVQPEWIEVVVSKEHLYNHFTGGYLILLDQSGEHVYVRDLVLIDENRYRSKLPCSFEGEKLYIHIALYRQFKIEDIHSRDVYDSVYLGSYNLPSY